MRIINFFVKIISTSFFVGYLPFIPGTFGSAFGIILYYFVKNNIYFYGYVTLSVIILGLLVSGRAEEVFQQKDSRRIVIDEVAGILLALLFIPYDIKLVIIAFVIFRILDALKPYPINKIQEFKGSAGVMGDDILAGIYTNIILQIVFRVASFRAS